LLRWSRSRCDNGYQAIDEALEEERDQPMGGEAMSDGGHASPNITPDMNVDGGPGMSLRDYFAARAPTAPGEYRVPNGPENESFTSYVARVHSLWAYEYADAMLKAREQK
jgi:hypothetical protein